MAPARIIIPSRDSFRHFSFFMGSSIYPCIQINRLLSIRSEKGNSKQIDKGALPFTISAITLTEHQIMVWMGRAGSVWCSENLARRGERRLERWVMRGDSDAYSGAMEVFAQKEKSGGFFVCWVAVLTIIF